MTLPAAVIECTMKRAAQVEIDGRRRTMVKYSRLITFLVVFFLCGSAFGQVQQENVILSVTSNTVQWAAVYKVHPDRSDDPYVHVRVFERQKGWEWEPWRFKELVFHMAVTPKALETSRIDRKAKIYAYKDVEIRSAYRRWLEDPAARGDVPICDTNILDCIKYLPVQ
ncbi:DUF5086 family protein [Neorhizobium sp. T6_25]|uniref:DUF5086 family protein n=1 Tax=Neorhizobium sp. T6_25 TaxID=2093833 RepID=UPI001FE0D283|nr:DUF5086 family protein [Neorhizobium sp. T6_25]